MSRRYLIVLLCASLALLGFMVSGAGAQVIGPASILNLTDWKLTLPVAAVGSTVAAEVKQPQLASYSDRYFRANSAQDGVVFTAPVGGATTPSSSYPRSELREMTGGGTQNASWSTTRGVNTMVVTEAVKHLPPVKPQVVSAQLWGPETDLIEILADGKNPRRPGTVKLAVRFKGESQERSLDETYVPGARFTVTLTAENGKIRVAYNGIPKLVFRERASGMYFKAGAYTQSNPSKGDEPDEYGQVVIYALQVTHTG